MICFSFVKKSSDKQNIFVVENKRNPYVKTLSKPNTQKAVLKTVTNKKREVVLLVLFAHQYTLKSYS